MSGEPNSFRHLSQELVPQLPPKEPSYEHRKYMSKSQRACDFCRSRKSACRSTDVGLSCRLCSSHGRQCTFVSGSSRASNRRPRRGDRQEALLNRNVGLTEPDAVLGRTRSHSIEEGGIQEEPAVAQGRHGTDLSFGGSPEDCAAVTAAGEQVQTDLEFFPQQMVSSVDGPALEEFPENEPNAASGENPPFDIHPLLDHDFFDIPILFPEDCPVDSEPENVITHVMGPTGDQNPHLIKYHRFDTQNLFIYNRISYRTVADPQNDVQFEYTRVEPSSLKTEQLPNAQTLVLEKIKLDGMIPPEAGEKLIQLCEQPLFLNSKEATYSHNQILQIHQPPFPHPFDNGRTVSIRQPFAYTCGSLSRRRAICIL